MIELLWEDRREVKGSSTLGSVLIGTSSLAETVVPNVVSAKSCLSGVLSRMVIDDYLVLVNAFGLF